MRTSATRRVTAAFVGLLLLGGLVLSGCAAHSSGASSGPGAATASVRPWSQITPLAQPRDYVGPSTAILPAADIEPIVAKASPQLPATVTDTQGTKVTVTNTDRILAVDLYGSLAATVYGLGLGDHLVGRDQSTGFPAAKKLPLVTESGHQLNAEAILALHPSVFITDTTLGPWDVVLQIRDAGIPVVVVDSKRSLADVNTLVTQIAAALGVGKEGAALNTRLSAEQQAEETQIGSVAPKDPTQRLRMLFLYVRGQAGVYYIFGKGTGADSLIDALDGVDVASDSGINGFSPLTAEALAKAKPDVILMMTGGLESTGGVDGALKLPGVSQTPAGQHRRIVDMSDYQVLSFGPLASSVLDALARALYAPQSVSAAAR